MAGGPVNVVPMSLIWAAAGAVAGGGGAAASPIIFKTSASRKWRTAAALAAAAMGAAAGGLLGARTSDWRFALAAGIAVAAGGMAMAVDLPPDMIVPHKLTYPVAGAAAVSAASWGAEAALTALAAGAAAFGMVWIIPRSGGGDMRLTAALTALAAGGAGAAALWVMALSLAVWMAAGGLAAITGQVLLHSRISAKFLKTKRLPMTPGVLGGALAGLTLAAGA